MSGSASIGPGVDVAPVEIVIACHNPARPIGRAVESVLAGNGEVATVTVVCHNAEVADIAAAVAEPWRSATRFLALQDGIASPAGPFNYGISQARSPWVGVMGSDDVLEAGAVALWLKIAKRTGAEAVITRLRRGLIRPRPIHTPVRRLGFSWLGRFWPTAGKIELALADPVRDRLFYRSAPLGIMCAAKIKAEKLFLVPHLPVGEDVPFVARLWTSAAVAIQTGGPGYLIGEDAADRVTQEPRPIATELAHIRHLFSQEWLTQLSGAALTALGTKTLRIHVFGAVLTRPDPAWWSETERANLASIAELLLRRCPAAAAPLSIADRRLLATIRSPHLPAERLLTQARRRRQFYRPSTWLCLNPCYLAHREAPPRFMAASALIR